MLHWLFFSFALIYAGLAVGAEYMAKQFPQYPGIHKLKWFVILSSTVFAMFGIAWL